MRQLVNKEKIKILKKLSDNIIQNYQLPLMLVADQNDVEVYTKPLRNFNLSQRLGKTMSYLSNRFSNSIGHSVFGSKKGGKKTQKRNLKLSTSTSRKRNNVRK